MFQREITIRVTRGITRRLLTTAPNKSWRCNGCTSPCRYPTISVLFHLCVWYGTDGAVTDFGVSPNEPIAGTTLEKYGKTVMLSAPSVIPSSDTSLSSQKANKLEGPLTRRQPFADTRT